MSDLALSSPQVSAAPAQRPWAMMLVLGVALFIAEGHRFDWTTRDYGTADESATYLTEGTGMHRAGSLMLGACGIVALWMGQRHGIRVQNLLGALLIFFFAWTVASILWADDRGLAARRVASFVAVALAALAAADRMTIRDMLVLVLLSTLACLVIGVAAEVGQQTFHLGDPDYRFAGTMHANSQGENCATLFLTAVVLASMSKRGRSLLYTVAVVAAGFLVLTGSRTALAGLLLALVFYATVQRAKAHVVALAAALIVAVVMVAMIVDETGLYQAVLLNREDTSSVSSLTGRTPLWAECWEYVLERPLLGYGYGAFWVPERIVAISDSQDWIIFSAHSSYIEMALNVGLVGAAAFVGIMALSIANFASLCREHRNQEYAFAAAALVLLAVEMALESTFSDPLLLVFVCMTLTARLGLVAVSPASTAMPAELGGVRADGGAPRKEYCP
jgi:exopolysaccharide production protein ExoQ